MSRLLVGNKAPHFEATAVIGDRMEGEFSLAQFEGKYVIFFFYPLDFTFVCPTELHAFQERLSEFNSRGAEVVACSVDSHYSHHAWLNTPKNRGGIQGITFPIVSDLNKSISRSYHVLSQKEDVAFRGLFLIDKEGIIRHMLVNDLPLGRSVDEALRTLDALIHHEEVGEVCPANWQSGKQAMEASREGLEKYFD